MQHDIILKSDIASLINHVSTEYISQSSFLQEPLAELSKNFFLLLNFVIIKIIFTDCQKIFQSSMSCDILDFSKDKFSAFQVQFHVVIAEVHHLIFVLIWNKAPYTHPGDISADVFIVVAFFVQFLDVLSYFPNLRMLLLEIRWLEKVLVDVFEVFVLKRR